MNSTDFIKNQIVRRIWAKDYTVWKEEPAEISNRLGWLTVSGLMRSQLLELKLFAREVIEAGFKHVVLLGMGGSSLGAEVLNRTFGSAPGFPRMIILDSTVPETVISVTDDINPSETLFIVSSKSGTTAEPLLLYRYFKGLVEHVRGDEYGRNFAAITDAGTPLAELAENNGFRHIFINPSDIGGRYSVLSLFGLVPAALLGIDIGKLLDTADEMRKSCGISSVEGNPGCRLAAFIGDNALAGRDKLTLITSPAISSFGLWVEQLIAESTGKEGKGVIPVIGEPLLAPDFYGKDRRFVYVRLAGDDNAAVDLFIEKIEKSGQPSMKLELNNKLDLGAEFFRWEFAVALVGSMLGINPFDQPDVQRAKDAAKKALEDISSPLASQGLALRSWGEILDGVPAGGYLSLLAFLNQSQESDDVFTLIRRRITEKYRIPVTVGYGPRYLHSTGQLHKGGPNSGIFLLITAGHFEDVIVPGESYTFGEVADAQALGDYQALKASGRKVARFYLPKDDLTELTVLKY